MIYITGDSFATGEEINDHQFPTYPGDGWIMDAKPWKEWHKQRTKELIAKYGTYHAYIEASKKESWGAMVSQYAGKDFLNTAISGASMMTIQANTQMALRRLQNEGKKVEQAYVMITSPHRISLFLPEGQSYNPETSIETLSPMFEHLPYSNTGTNYMRSWVAAEDDCGMLCRWMMHFLAIRDTIISLTGVEPVFLDSSFVAQHELDNLEERMKTPISKELWKYVKPHFPDEEHRMSTYNCDDPRTPLGHYGWATHHRFAKALAYRYHL